MRLNIDQTHPDYVVIEGVKYAYECFTQLGGLLPLNTPFRIDDRTDGSLTISRLNNASVKELRAYLLLQMANPVIATAPNEPVVKQHVERLNTWVNMLTELAGST